MLHGRLVLAQVTVWIMVWIWVASWLPGLMRALLGFGGDGALAAALPTPASLMASAAALPQTLRAAFDGFTLPVWGVVVLKAMNGILIPATFKYADNIVSCSGVEPAPRPISSFAAACRCFAPEYNAAAPALPYSHAHHPRIADGPLRPSPLVLRAQLYAYAKPSSIVVTTVLSCVLARSLPSPSMALGVTAVVASIVLYSSKPKAKAE